MSPERLVRPGVRARGCRCRWVRRRASAGARPRAPRPERGGSTRETHIGIYVMKLLSVFREHLLIVSRTNKDWGSGGGSAAPPPGSSNGSSRSPAWLVACCSGRPGGRACWTRPSARSRDRGHERDHGDAREQHVVRDVGVGRGTRRGRFGGRGAQRPSSSAHAAWHEQATACLHRQGHRVVVGTPRS